MNTFCCVHLQEAQLPLREQGVSLVLLPRHTLGNLFFFKLAKIHGNRRMEVCKNSSHSSLTCPF